MCIEALEGEVEVFGVVGGMDEGFLWEGLAVGGCDGFEGFLDGGGCFPGVFVEVAVDFDWVCFCGEFIGDDGGVVVF